VQERAPLLEPLSAIRIQVAPAASFLNFLQSTQGNAVPVPRCMVVTSVRNPRTWLPRSALVPFSVLSFPSLYRTRFMRYPFIVFDLHCSLTCICLCLHLSSRPVNLFSDFYSAACSLSSTRPNSARGPLPPKRARAVPQMARRLGGMDLYTPYFFSCLSAGFSSCPFWMMGLGFIRSL